MTVAGRVIVEGDWISIDGTNGDVFLGRLETMVPDISDPWLMRLLTWADEVRKLRVRANADYPVDAERARRYGRKGSASPAPSTCSLRPSACRSCRR